MNSDIIPREELPPAIREIAGEIATLTVEQLRAELARTMEATAKSLLRLSAIVQELDRRGEPLTDLRGDLIGWLRRIANGSVLPEVVVRYQGRPMLLHKIATLPVSEQRQFSRGEPVLLVVPDEQGGYTQRAVQPAALGREQISQLFTSDGCLRSIGEQKAYLEEMALRSQRLPKKKARRRTSQVRADPDRGGLVVGKVLVPLADILAALADLRGSWADPTEDDATAAVPVTLSGDEHHRIRVLAAQGNTSMAELIRRALRASGILTES